MSVEYKLSVSDAQALKMRRGHSVRIPASGIGVGSPVMVSPDQAKKLDRAKRAGKGATIRLSPEQINSMLMSGGGIFDKLKSVARKFRGVVAPVAGVAKDVLAPVAEELFKEAKGRLTKKARQKALEVGKSLLDKGLKRVGAGMKPRGRPRKVKGGLSFGDVVSGVKKAVDIGKQVYEVGKPLIDPLAKAGFENAKARLMKGRAKGAGLRPVKRNYVASGSDEPVQYDGLAVKGGVLGSFNFSKLNITPGDIAKGYVEEGVRIARKARDVTKPVYQVAKSLGILPDDPRFQIATKLIYGEGLAPAGMSLGRGMKKAKKTVTASGLAPPGMRARGRGMKKSKVMSSGGLFNPGMRR